MMTLIEKMLMTLNTKEADVQSSCVRLQNSNVMSDLFEKMGYLKKISCMAHGTA